MAIPAPEVAIVATGEMGAGLARLLTASGARVRTSVGERSAATIRRAREAGCALFDDDVALVEGADVLLSIVPPAEAEGLAKRLAPALAGARHRPVYVDCNAISPQAVDALARIVTRSGARFVDGAILGLAPGVATAATPAKCPRIFISGADAEAIRHLSAYGLDIRIMTAPIGAASALKCAYAAIGKGIIALASQAILAAHAAGVEADLKQELSSHLAGIFSAASREIPTLPTKAYRWVEEMRQIGDFLAAVEGGQTTFTGCSDLFAMLTNENEAVRGGQPGKAMDTLLRFVTA